MVQFFYTFLIYCYKSAIHIASLFNKKAKLKVSGISESKKIISNRNNQPSECIFIHCASQGEHEQTLPIIRWILEKTHFTILISFYSPSGYLNADYSRNPRVDKIYLPFDTRSEMIHLFTAINPSKVIIVKNEWWWNMLDVLNEMKIESYLISSTIRKDHYFIRFATSFFRNRIKAFSTVFVIDEDSKNHFDSAFNIPSILSGDTRIDQVLFNKNKSAVPFSNNKMDKIVYGSVWLNDIDSMLELIALYPKASHLIYPHELSESNVFAFQKYIKSAQIINQYNPENEGIFIINEMGQLKYAYKYASLAYIGGGFGYGIHNILEAAVFTIPTIFGPNFQKSNEAKELVKKGCSFSFHKSQELKAISIKLNNQVEIDEIADKLKVYFSPVQSPTKIICQNIFSKV